MSAQATNAAIESDDDQSSLKRAYDAVNGALQELSLSDHKDQWIALQQRYFDLKAAMRARDPEFQNIDLGGTRLHVPSSHARIGNNPTVEDVHAEVEVPTRNDGFRVLDGLQVCDATNPHTTHAVHVDHVITTAGDVRLEVNASTLDELPGGD